MRYHLAATVLLVAAIAVTLTGLTPPSLALYDLSPRGTDATSSSDLDVIVSEVDCAFQQDWDARDLDVAPAANRMCVARRLALAMIGTIPSLEEQKQLEAFSTDVEAINWWCDHLLRDRRYADYQAERLARALVGVEEGPFLIFRRRRFVMWLSDQLYNNIPYDEMVRQLITADGLWTDVPAVNFLTVTTSDDNEGRPDPVRLAGRTSRAFLGVRLDCMQCHDDNLGGPWLQSDFHQLAAFYAAPTPTLVGIVDHPRDYSYKYLDGESEKVIEPDVPFDRELLKANGDSRERLAGWVTHSENRPFARAIVNRVWGLAFGQPLVDPVDDIPLDGPFPPGLELIAEDFVDHRFDLARVWQVIARCAPFWRASAADFAITPAHEDCGAVFPVTRLRPEQIAGAILQSARLTTVDANSHVLLRLGQYEQLNQFAMRYGDAGADELGAHGGTIPQRLLLMNGDLVKERTQPDLVANSATRIAALSPDARTAVRATFRTILVRDPSKQELTHFVERIKNVAGRSWEQKLEDLAWVLMNSTEFSWNH